MNTSWAPPSSNTAPTVDSRFETLSGVKVALFTGNYNYVKEGANQALNRLVRHLEDRVGAAVRVYSPVTATPAFEPEGILVPVASVPLPGRAEFQLALGLPRAIRADIRAFAPDIVHVATPDILCTRAQTFAKQLGVPVIASVHTRFETYADYYGLGFLRPLLQRHLDRFYRRSDMILAPTPAIAADMASVHGPKKLRLWARGVDTALFDPARRSIAWREGHGIGPDDSALLFFGRMVLEKGTERFAETVGALRQRGLAIRPVIVGEGPARDRMAAALPDAIFTGHLTGPALATAIASSDIMLNPSLTEAFGNVTLEAMAAGLAVIAANVSSASNLIDHGRSGLLCAPDTASYADAVMNLIADPVRRAALGHGARTVAMGWRWDHILDTVLESYAMLLGRKAGQSC